MKFSLVALASGVALGAMYGVASAGLSFGTQVFVIALVVAAPATGVVLGIAVARAGLWAGVRSLAVLFAVSSMSAFLCLWAGWAVWLEIIVLPPDSDLSLLVPPGILQIISALTLDAPWCLDAWCPKGITIVAIWLLEALAIFIPCILLVIASAWVPYCHACNTTTLNYFANAVTGTPDDVAELRSQLETGDLDTLVKLPLDEDRGHTECALELCSCRSLALLTVEYVWFGASALGTLDHRRSDVVFQLTLEPPRLEDAMLLRDIRFEEDPRSDEDA